MRVRKGRWYGYCCVVMRASKSLEGYVDLVCFSTRLDSLPLYAKVKSVTFFGHRQSRARAPGQNKKLPPNPSSVDNHMSSYLTHGRCRLGIRQGEESISPSKRIDPVHDIR